MSTMTLKNAKGEGDFLRLRFWGAVLLMLGALLALGAGSAHAAALAGSTIGNQASASYSDNSGTSRLTVSNSVSTVVAQVYSANLTQTQAKIGAPGQTLSFPHTISNTGNGADTFVVTVGNIVTAATFSPAPTSANAIFPDANCDGIADSSTVIGSVGPVAAGGVGCFVVQVTLASTGTTGSLDVGYASSVPASATLSANGVVNTSTNTDSVTVSGNAVIAVTKSISISTGPTGTTVVYQLTYRNTGTVSAGNVVIADTLPAGAAYVAGSGRWSVATGTALTDLTTDGATGAVPNRIFYGRNLQNIVAVIERVDPGVQGILEFQATLTGAADSYVYNKAQWCYKDIGTGGTTQPVAGAGVQTACNNAISGATTNGYGGNYVPGTIFTVDVPVITGTNNTTTVSNTVPFYIPAVAVAGSVVYNAISGAATPGTVGVASTAAQVTGLANNDTDVAYNTAGQGTNVTWDTYVWNTGTGSDTFNITLSSVTGASNFPSGTSFLFFRSDGVTPLTDSNSDGQLDTGPVAGAASYRVRVVAVLPPSIPSGTTYNAVLLAQSTTTTTSVNAMVVRADIVNSRVDLKNYGAGTNGTGQSADGDTGAGQVGIIRTVTANPGTVATFGLIVNNSGLVADSYNLAYNVGSGVYASTAPYAFTTPGTLPTGVTLAFFRDNGSACTSLGAQISNTGVISAGGQINACALVTIPAGTAAGTTQIYFRALSPTTFTGAFTTSSGDVKRDALTINQVRLVSITPNNSGQIFPGGSIQYCHSVTNGGNVSETLSVVQADQSLYTSGASVWAQFATVYPDPNGNCILDDGATAATNPYTASVFTAGQTKKFIVVVQAPGAALAGEVDVNSFTVTAATALGYTPTATDTTVIVVGQVSLVKDQVIDPTGTACSTVFNTGNLAAINGFAFTQAPISTGSIPGACIIYRVTATNVGTAPITGMTISDAVPANTAITAITNVATPFDAFSPATVVGTSVVCTVAFTSPTLSCGPVATLNGGEKSYLYFRVKIN